MDLPLYLKTGQMANIVSKNQTAAVKKRALLFSSYWLFACLIYDATSYEIDPPHSQEQFECFFRVNPKCVQSSLVLIENTALLDKFQREVSRGVRRKKQRTQH